MASIPSNTVKVFIDPSWRETGERLLPLARYLFGLHEHALPTFRDEFAHNMPFESVELAESAEGCDFIYLPISFEPSAISKYHQLIDALERDSATHHRPVVVQAHSKDVVEPKDLELPFSNCIYLNSALIRSISPENFQALPYFIPDCLDKYYDGRVNVLEKSDVPSIGFCGVAAPLKTPFGKTKLLDFARLALTVVDDLGGDCEKIARRLGTNMKHAHRTKAILRMKYSRKVKFDCILRAEGGLVNNNYTNTDDLDPYNTEFYGNLNRNLYSLCSRGTENYSVRFYETLCMGRIPVLIDTDVVLPFESQIDYDTHCVLVNKKDTKNVVDQVLLYHAKRNCQQLKAIQIENRKLWSQYFSSDNFWRSFMQNDCFNLG